MSVMMLDLATLNGSVVDYSFFAGSFMDYSKYVLPQRINEGDFKSQKEKNLCHEILMSDGPKAMDDEHIREYGLKRKIPQKNSLESQ